jgi:hypothetical protein
MKPPGFHATSIAGSRAFLRLQLRQAGGQIGRIVAAEKPEKTGVSAIIQP